MRNMLIVVSLCGLWAGCAASNVATRSGEPERGTDAPAPASDAGLSFQLLAGGGDGAAARGVGNRAELASGTRFSLRIVAEQPAFVYLWHRRDGAAATAERVLPPEGGAAAQARPQSPIVLDGIKLDDQPGKEYFFAVASRTALDDGRLQALAADMPIEREPPMTSASDRDGGPLYRVTMDESGLARLLFTILHVKQP